MCFYVCMMLWSPNIVPERYRVAKKMNRELTKSVEHVQILITHLCIMPRKLQPQVSSMTTSSLEVERQAARWQQRFRRISVSCF